MFHGGDYMTEESMDEMTGEIKRGVPLRSEQRVLLLLTVPKLSKFVQAARCTGVLNLWLCVVGLCSCSVRHSQKYLHQLKAELKMGSICSLSKSKACNSLAFNWVNIII